MKSKSGIQNLLRSKFLKPISSTDLILRPDLLKGLSEDSKKPLILISAPSGYGKSTLISTWLEQRICKYGWISLSEFDNDWFTFIRYFVEGLKYTLEANFDEVAALLNSPELPDAEIITNKIINTLAELKDDFYLVLDDYHYLHEKVIHDFLNVILRFPPPKFHLIIITRIDPPFRIPHLRTKNLIHEIRSSDLSFKLEETHEFLNNALGDSVDLDFCRKANEITEGWISGLRLVSLKSKTRSVYAQTYSFEENRNIAQTLLDDIFIDFSSDVQDFILKCSILNQFNVSLCTTICGYGNESMASEVVKFLSGSNLFIIPVDQDQGWFRFHHLFQDYLRAKFEMSYSETERKSVHSLAGNWLLNNGMHKTATVHFIQSGDIDKAAEVFEVYRHQLMNEANWQELIQTFRFFDDQSVDSYVELQLVKAWINIYDGEPFEMFSLLDSIPAMINDAPLSSERKKRYLAELNCLLPYKTYNLERDYQKVISQCDFALEFLQEDQQYVKGYAWIFKLGGLQLIGKYLDAKKLFAKSIEEKKSSIINNHLNLVMNYLQWMEADVDAMIQSSSHLITIAKENKNDEAFANGSHFCGIGKYLTNDLESSKNHLQHSYGKRHFTIGVIKAMNSIALAFCHLGQNNIKEAEQILQEIKSEFKKKRSFYFNVLFEAAHAEIYLHQNRTDQALAKLTDVEQLPILPFSNFYVPQFTLVKALIYEGDNSSLEKASDLLKHYVAFSTETHNRLFRLKFIALQSLQHYCQNDFTKAFSLIEELIVMMKTHRLFGLFIDCGPLMKDLLLRYDLILGKHPIVNELIQAFPENPDRIIFTNRELDVLPLLNLTNKEIAQKLFIAEKTVKRHSNNIFKKLQVKNRREALHKAMELKLV